MNVLENLLGVLNAFTGLSALAGGVAILAGWDRFSGTMAQGNPLLRVTHFPLSL
ncbi:MAG: hypothetical protein U5L96_06585 [Owenweeksia sp.]|nr:hypothetical protein [Owenweeksia sp.]